MSCSRCASESIYADGLEIFDEFNTLLINNNVICHNPHIKLLSILFSLESQWVQCNKLCELSVRKYGKIPPGSVSDFITIDNTYNQISNDLYNWQYCYDYWRNLSLEEKELCYKRAVRFRTYFD